MAGCGEDTRPACAGGHAPACSTCRARERLHASSRSSTQLAYVRPSLPHTGPAWREHSVRSQRRRAAARRPSDGGATLDVLVLADCTCASLGVVRYSCASLARPVLGARVLCAAAHVLHEALLLLLPDGALEVCTRRVCVPEDAVSAATEGARVAEIS